MSSCRTYPNSKLGALIIITRLFLLVFWPQERTFYWIINLHKTNKVSVGRQEPTSATPKRWRSTFEGRLFEWLTNITSARATYVLMMFVTLNFTDSLALPSSELLEGNGSAL